MIGRDAELAQVADRLADRRLVTLVGAGGMGKTTLAAAAAQALADRYDEGTRTIDLTLVDSAAAVRSSLAGQLGYSSWGALLDTPGEHSVLIVVDNCEHVTDAAAEAVADLLDVCQMPSVIATSRVALGLPGEAVVTLGPLQLPPVGAEDGPAVELFVERANDAGVELRPSAGIAELCRRLDGVPLAIELAAARSRSMTPEEMLERLSGGLDLLDRPRRRSPRRHRSLRAAIDWSHDLLDTDTKAVFADLSVFAGPFTATAAHAVTAAPGDTLATTQDRLDDLVSTSMIVAGHDGPVTYYRLLHTMRAFGREQLDAAGRTHQVEVRFIDHVVAQARDIIGRGSASWSSAALGDLLALYGNLAAAIRWCLDHDNGPDRGYLLVAVLWGLVHQAHTEEIGELADQVLARWPEPGHRLWGDAVATAATCQYMVGDHAGAIERATRALDDAERSPVAPATLRRAIAQASRATGDVDAALEWFASAAEVARGRGLVSMATEADSARAQILADVGELDAAHELIAAAIDEATAAGSEVGMAWATVIHGSILLRSDPVRAKAVLEAALADTRAVGYDAGISVALRSLALAELCVGDQVGAARRARELFDELLARGSTYELRLVLDVVSVVLARAGRSAAAADLAATALDLPVVSITASVGHELFPLDPTGGTVLSTRESMVVARSKLAAVLDGADPEAREGSARGGADGGAATAPRGVFRRIGDVWEVGFDGDTVTIRHGKGMVDLTALLDVPGREVHCLDLAGGGVDQPDTGAVIDETARRAYEQRVRDLQGEVDDAEGDNDTGRAERARTELDALVGHLTEALGMGGRPRTSGSSAERARSTVTQRVRSTIRRIEAHHPRLGRHLAAAIHTGTYCSYDPEVPVHWDRS